MVEKKVRLQPLPDHVCVCGKSLLLLRSLSYKICTECNREYEWELAENQERLIQHQR
jgi:hypothetical protein